MIKKYLENKLENNYNVSQYFVDRVHLVKHESGANIGVDY